MIIVLTGKIHQIIRDENGVTILRKSGRWEKSVYNIYSKAK